MDVILGIWNGVETCCELGRMIIMGVAQFKRTCGVCTELSYDVMRSIRKGGSLNNSRLSPINFPLRYSESPSIDREKCLPMIDWIDVRSLQNICG